MIPAIIDTALFSIPPHAVSEEEVHAIVLRVVRWSSYLAAQSPVRLFKLSDTDAVLALCGCWPIEDDIETLLTLNNLDDVFGVRDVTFSYMSILSRALEWGDTYVEVTECEPIVIEPDVLLGHVPESLVEHTKLVYATSCFNENVNLARPYVISGLPLEVERINISGSVTGLKTSTAVSIDMPAEIDGSVFLIDGIEAIARRRSPIDVWNSATEASDYYAAICFGCLLLEAQAGKSLTLSDLPAFSIGSEFIESLEAVQGAPSQQRAKLVLETCCRILLGRPKYPINSMGKPKQLVRQSDGATAWRTHLFKRHEAGRLMLWNIGGTYEFANAGVKDELYIGKGEINLRYSYRWD